MFTPKTVRRKWIVFRERRSATETYPSIQPKGTIRSAQRCRSSYFFIILFTFLVLNSVFSSFCNLFAILYSSMLFAFFPFFIRISILGPILLVLVGCTLNAAFLYGVFLLHAPLHNYFEESTKPYYMTNPSFFNTLSYIFFQHFFICYRIYSA